MTKTILIFLAALITTLFSISISADAVYIYKNIKPGKTTNKKVSEILGEPLDEVGPSTFKYKSTQEGINTYVVKYKEGNAELIVERIDINFQKPFKSKPLAKTMKLPQATSTGISSDGKFEEYFASKYSVVFVHKTGSPESGVETMSIYSPELFDSLSDYKDKPKTKAKKSENDIGETAKINTKPQKEKPTIDAKKHMQQGMTYVSLAHANPKTKTENYNNALIEFSKAIEIYPNYAEAYSDRGVIYMQQKKYNKAEEDLKKASELKPDDPIILYNLAALYSVLKKNDIAIDYLDEALGKGFNNFDALKPKGRKSDPDLNNLRKDPEYKKVLEKHKIFIY